ATSLNAIPQRAAIICAARVASRRVAGGSDASVSPEVLLPCFRQLAGIGKLAALSAALPSRHIVTMQPSKLPERRKTTSVELYQEHPRESTGRRDRLVCRVQRVQHR